MIVLAAALLVVFVWGGGHPEMAGLIPPLWDKVAHVGFFAMLAGLLVRGLPGGLMRTGLIVALACTVLGVWDEWRQLTLPGRNAGLDDLLADLVGIGLGVFVAAWAIRQPRRAGSET
jgi:VanZ family protein